MIARGVVLVVLGLFLLSAGGAEAVPIKMGKGISEIQSYSGSLQVLGWKEMLQYENGVKYTGNPKPGSKLVDVDLSSAYFQSAYFQIDAAESSDGPAFFAAFSTKQTKKGEVTKVKWGEIFENKKGKHKVRWHPGEIPYSLGSLVANGDNYIPGDNNGPGDHPNHQVPEPGTLLLLGLGLVGLAASGGARFKRK